MNSRPATKPQLPQQRRDLGWPGKKAWRRCSDLEPLLESNWNIVLIVAFFRVAWGLPSGLHNPAPITCFFQSFPLHDCLLLSSPSFQISDWTATTQLLYNVLVSDIQQSESVQFTSVQLLSHVQLFATPWTVARQASTSITNSWWLDLKASQCPPFLTGSFLYPTNEKFSEWMLNF